MSKPVTGIVHVHSDFSHDGFSSIADLADFAREAGLQFVGLADHAEDLTSEDMKSVRRQCKKHSDESCVMIPGLEFRCSADIHILGLGIAEDIQSGDAVTVASQIGARGGLAILAHPSRTHYQCTPELCSVLNGIEIWNAAYDGRFVPPLASLDLLQRARGCNPAIFGFGGTDLHRLQRAPGVILQLRVNGAFSVNTHTVLHFLRSGRFAVSGRYVVFDSHVLPNWLPRSSLWAFRKFYEVSKAIRDGALGED